MDEKSDQIIDQIEAQRDRLGHNLDELQEKVRRTADWRTHFDKNPMLILGAALGGGLLLGATLGGSGKSRHSYRSNKSLKVSSEWDNTPSAVKSSLSASGYSTPSHAAEVPQGRHRQEVFQAMDAVKGAMIAFGISKAKEFLSQAVPGLEQHIGDIEHKMGLRSDARPSDRREGDGTDYRAGNRGYSNPESTGSAGRNEREYEDSETNRSPFVNA